MADTSIPSIDDIPYVNEQKTPAQPLVIKWFPTGLETWDQLEKLHCASYLAVFVLDLIHTNKQFDIEEIIGTSDAPINYYNSYENDNITYWGTLRTFRITIYPIGVDLNTISFTQTGADEFAPVARYAARHLHRTIQREVRERFSRKLYRVDGKYMDGLCVKIPFAAKASGRHTHVFVLQIYDGPSQFRKKIEEQVGQADQST